MQWNGSIMRRFERSGENVGLWETMRRMAAAILNRKLPLLVIGVVIIGACQKSTSPSGGDRNDSLPGSGRVVVVDGGESQSIDFSAALAQYHRDSNQTLILLAQDTANFAQWWQWKPSQPPPSQPAVLISVDSNGTGDYAVSAEQAQIFLVLGNSQDRWFRAINGIVHIAQYGWSGDFVVVTFTGTFANVGQPGHIVQVSAGSANAWRLPDRGQGREQTGVGENVLWLNGGTFENVMVRLDPDSVQAVAQKAGDSLYISIGGPIAEDLDFRSAIVQLQLPYDPGIDTVWWQQPQAFRLLLLPRTGGEPVFLRSQEGMTVVERWGNNLGDLVEGTVSGTISSGAANVASVKVRGRFSAPLSK